MLIGKLVQPMSVHRSLALLAASCFVGLAGCAGEASREERLNEALRSCDVPEGVIGFSIQQGSRLVLDIDHDRVTPEQLLCFTRGARDAGFELPIGGGR